MKIESVTDDQQTVAIGDLKGGDTFQVMKGGCVYLRATGTREKLNLPPNIKLALVIDTGVTCTFQKNKQVFPIKVIAKVYGEARSRPDRNVDCDA